MQQSQRRYKLRGLCWPEGLCWAARQLYLITCAWTHTATKPSDVTEKLKGAAASL